MARISLTVIPEPTEGTRSVIVTETDEVNAVIAVEGKTEPKYSCGACGRLLMVGTTPEQVRNVVLKCPRCGAFNDTGDISAN